MTLALSILAAMAIYFLPYEWAVWFWTFFAAVGGAR